MDNSFTDKPVRLSEHAKERLWYRGAAAEEVIECIKTTKWQPAKRNRLQCSKDIAFNGIWNGRNYKTKQVNPVFVEEETEIIVITIYVYYF